IVSANTTQKNFLIFRLCSLRIALYIFDNSTWIFLVNHLSILIKDISITSELSRLILLIILFSSSISSSFCYKLVFTCIIKIYIGYIILLYTYTPILYIFSCYYYIP